MASDATAEENTLYFALSFTTNSLMRVLSLTGANSGALWPVFSFQKKEKGKKRQASVWTRGQQDDGCATFLSVRLVFRPDTFKASTINMCSSQFVSSLGASVENPRRKQVNGTLLDGVFLSDKYRD